MTSENFFLLNLIVQSSVLSVCVRKTGCCDSGVFSVKGDKIILVHKIKGAAEQ